MSEQETILTQNSLENYYAKLHKSNYYIYIVTYFWEVIKELGQDLFYLSIHWKVWPIIYCSIIHADNCKNNGGEIVISGVSTGSISLLEFKRLVITAIPDRGKDKFTVIRMTKWWSIEES